MSKLEDLKKKLDSSTLLIEESKVFDVFPQHGEMLSKMSNMLYNLPEGSKDDDSLVSFALIRSQKEEQYMLYVIAFNTKNEDDDLWFVFGNLDTEDLCFSKAVITACVGTMCRMNDNYIGSNIYAQLIQNFNKEVGNKELSMLQMNDCPEEYAKLFTKGETEIKVPLKKKSV